MDGPPRNAKPSQALRRDPAPPSVLGRIHSLLLGPPQQPAGANGQLRFPACKRCANSVGTVNIACSFLMILLKGFLGVVGGSRALLADAIHSTADLLSAILMVVGFKIARRPIDGSYPWGYGKIEYVVSAFIYMMLSATGVVVLVEAILCIVRRECTEPSVATIGGALIGIVGCELMFRQGICAGNQIGSPSMVANAWEKRSDAITSIAVLIGIICAKLGWHFMDAIAAIFVAIYLLKFSVGMVANSVRQLMDASLDPAIVEGIRKHVESIEGVRGIEAIRTREMGHTVAVDLDILVDGKLHLTSATVIREEVRRAVAQRISREVTISISVRAAPV